MAHFVPLINIHYLQQRLWGKPHDAQIQLTQSLLECFSSGEEARGQETGVRIASPGRKEKAEPSAQHVSPRRSAPCPRGMPRVPPRRHQGGRLPLRGTGHCSRTQRGSGTQARRLAQEISAHASPSGLFPPSRRPTGGTPRLWMRCERVHGAAAPHSCQNPWLPTEAALLLAVRVTRR